MEELLFVVRLTGKVPRVLWRDAAGRVQVAGGGAVAEPTVHPACALCRLSVLTCPVRFSQDRFREQSTDLKCMVNSSQFRGCFEKRSLNQPSSPAPQASAVSEKSLPSLPAQYQRQASQWPTTAIPIKMSQT